MPQHQLLFWLTATWGLLFVIAFGAICGSFINVIVYRVPRGLNIVTPPSACPACGTRLSWRENIPIVGWIRLRGRCRFCRSPISPEYPIVEFVVAALFGLIYAAWFMRPSVLWLLGIPVEQLTPEWAHAGLARMWPTLLLIYLLLGSLVAITLIDARTFTIPIVIPWIVTGAAFVIHPLHALIISRTKWGGLRASPFDWAIWTPPSGPTPWSGALGGSLGAALGIAVGLLLLHWRIIPRSFADYPEWEAKAQAEMTAREAQRAQAGELPGDTRGADLTFRVIMLRTMLLTGPALALMFAGFAVGVRYGFPLRATFGGMAVGLLIGVFLRRIAPNDVASGEPIWVQYPHARREVLKEVLFLLPCLGLGWLGWWLTGPAGPLGNLVAPLWLKALSGSLLGYLIGGGLVWAIRIGGSLAFGKEAMGQGDVHLMAAVGAVTGWIDPVLAFFTAPFFGITWALVGAILGRLLGRAGTALPYGPHLAFATVVVLVGKPAYEWALSQLVGGPVNLP